MGPGLPGLSVWGRQEADITAVTARDPPGVGPDVWRETNSRSEGHKEDFEEEALQLSASGLLALGPGCWSTVLWLTARGGRAFNPCGSGEGA